MTNNGVIYNLNVIKDIDGDISLHIDKVDDKISFRLSGPEPLGKTINIAKLEISANDLYHYIKHYAPEVLQKLLETDGVCETTGEFNWDHIDSPFLVLSPKCFREGNLWCFLHGGNLQDGIAGFGKTLIEAAKEFNNEWYKLNGQIMDHSTYTLNNTRITMSGVDITNDIEGINVIDNYTPTLKNIHITVKNTTKITDPDNSTNKPGGIKS